MILITENPDGGLDATVHAWDIKVDHHVPTFYKDVFTGTQALIIKDLQDQIENLEGQLLELT